MPTDLYGNNLVAGTVTANTTNGFIVDAEQRPIRVVWEDTSLGNGTITLGDLGDPSVDLIRGRWYPTAPTFEQEFTSVWYPSNPYATADPPAYLDNADIVQEEQEEPDCKELDDFLASFIVKQRSDINK